MSSSATVDSLQHHRERQAREMLKRRERELRREYWERKAWKYVEPVGSE